MDVIKDTCRLCNTAGSGLVDIFERSSHNEGTSYSGQILEMFQLELVDTPNWPRTGCRKCIKFLKLMKMFKKCVSETHLALDEMFQNITTRKSKVPDVVPIESVFVIEVPLGEIKEEKAASAEIVILSDDDSIGEVAAEVKTEERTTTEIGTSVGEAAFEKGSVEGDVVEAIEKGAANSEKTHTNDMPQTKTAKTRIVKKVRSVHEKSKLQNVMIEMGLLKCHICSKREDNLTALFTHCSAEHQEMARIICCNKSLHGQCNIYDHIAYHLNPDAFNCKDCDKRFINSRGLRAHRGAHHSEVPYHMREKRFKCSYCGRGFKCNSLLVIHVRRMHVRVYCHKCELCGKAFTDETYLKGHLAVHQRKADEKRRMQENSSERILGTKDGIEQCDICQKFYTNVAVHKSRHHGSRSRTAVDRSEWRKGKSLCDKCGLYYSVLNFKSHSSRCSNSLSTESGPIACQLCKRMCSNRSAFKKHMHYHTLTRRFECPHCDFKSISKGNRWRHIRYSHPEEYNRAKVDAVDKECVNHSGEGGPVLDGVVDTIVEQEGPN